MLIRIQSFQKEYIWVENVIPHVEHRENASETTLECWFKDTGPALREVSGGCHRAWSLVSSFTIFNCKVLESRCDKMADHPKPVGVVKSRLTESWFWSQHVAIISQWNCKRISMNSYFAIQILGGLREDRKAGFQAALMKNVQRFSLVS